MLFFFSFSPQPPACDCQMPSGSQKAHSPLIHFDIVNADCLLDQKIHNTKPLSSEPKLLLIELVSPFQYSSISIIIYFFPVV